MGDENNEKSALVPRLRFPKFRNGGAWRLHTLGNIGETISGLSGKSAEDFGKGSPFVTYRQIFENSFVALDKCGLVQVEKGERQNEVGYGDILITGSSETPEEVGFASVVLEKPPEKTYLNSFCFAFRQNPLPLCNAKFSQFLFHSPWYRAEVTNLAQGSTRFNISKLGFLKLKLPVPDQREQQEIADCLSFLDDLITAETQKLDALKAHKKGLMQQLFPSEGETVPRLRFAEFRGKEGWKEHPVSGMLEEAPRPVEMNDDEDYTLVTVKRRYGGIVLREVLKGRDILVKSQFRIKKDDFLISKRQIVHYACGVVSDDYDGAIVSNEYTILQSRKNCDIGFFNYFSQQPIVGRSFLECSVGIVIEKMLFKQDQWLKKKFLFPRLQEQRKIASCLSSLDDLITTQSQKIDALKIHKKGLMQQLFPVPDESQA